THFAWRVGAAGSAVCINALLLATIQLDILIWSAGFSTTKTTTSCYPRMSRRGSSRSPESVSDTGWAWPFCSACGTARRKTTTTTTEYSVRHLRLHRFSSLRHLLHPHRRRPRPPPHQRRVEPLRDNPQRPIRQASENRTVAEVSWTCACELISRALRMAH